MFLGGFGINPNIPFFGSKPMPYMEKSNVEFIKHATGYQWQPRNQTVEIYFFFFFYLNFNIIVC